MLSKQSLKRPKQTSQKKINPNRSMITVTFLTRRLVEGKSHQFQVASCWNLFVKLSPTWSQWLWQRSDDLSSDPKLIYFGSVRIVRHNVFVPSCTTIPSLSRFMCDDQFFPILSPETWRTIQTFLWRMFFTFFLWLDMVSWRDCGCEESTV